MANEHTYLVIVDVDVGLHHGIWDVIFVADIVVQKIEYHDGIIHRSLTISLNSKAIVVIPWFDGLGQFISHGWHSSGGSSQILMFFYQMLQ